MSYLAIARKYRPATFAEMVGQDHVVRTLQNALSSGRIHHAYLFCGARGVGKTTAARALAKALGCEKGPTPEPCGECSACIEIGAGRSPDLVEIDGASNNSVDDIRELRDTVSYAPVRGRYKVYLVDEVHMLSKPAFNALLKTLEEPPPHVVFIFATTEPNRIPETILSRVQRFDFKRISVQPVADRLQQIALAEGAQLSQAALRMIARAGEGSMRDAQSLLDKVISSTHGRGSIDDALVAETLGLVDRALLLSFLEGMLRGEPDRCLEIVDRIYSFGYEMSEFTAELLEIVRNATFLRLSQSAKGYIDTSPDEIVKLEAIVEGIAPEVLTRLFNALLDTHDQVSRAARPRIVLEMAVARLATVRPVEPLSGLLARLEDLERKLRTPAQGAARPPVRTAPRESLKKPEGKATTKAKAAELDLDDEPVLPSRPAPRKGKAATKASPEPAESDFFAGLVAESSKDDPQERWKRLEGALREQGGARLAEATASIRNKSLVLSLPAGRPLAEGRRQRGIPQIEGLIRKAFPQIDGISIEPLAGTGSPGEHQRALQQQILEDPDLQRIMQKLSAELDSVTELQDTPAIEPTPKP